MWNPRFTILSRLAAVVMGLLPSFPANGEAVTYTFTKIADTSGLFSSISLFPSINNAGTVAFLASGGKGL